MDSALLLADTVSRTAGQGDPLALSYLSRGKRLKLTLGITRILQQENLEVSVWGSRDGNRWERLTAFPPRSYCGNYTTTVDLTRNPAIRFIRAHWNMTRWNVVDAPPVFGFHLLAEEVVDQLAVGA